MECLIQTGLDQFVVPAICPGHQADKHVEEMQDLLTAVYTGFLFRESLEQAREDQRDHRVHVPCHHAVIFVDSLKDAAQDAKPEVSLLEIVPDYNLVSAGV